MKNPVIDELKHCLLRGVPLVQLSSGDQIALTANVTNSLAGDEPIENFRVQYQNTPVITWNIVQGCQGGNKLGWIALIHTFLGAAPAISAAKKEADFGEQHKQLTKPGPTGMSLLESKTLKPVDFLKSAQLFPEFTLVLAMNFHAHLQKSPTSPAVIQALANLRDPYKARVQFWAPISRVIDPEGGNRMFVMMMPDSDPLPPELRQDVVILDEPYPNAGERREIILKEFENAGIETPDGKKKDARAEFDTHVNLAIDAVCGMTAATISTEVALAVTRTGADIGRLQKRAVSLINQQQGMKVWSGKEDISRDIGGNANAIFYATRVATNFNPGIILFADEIEKGLSGAGGGGKSESSGTMSGMHGTILSYIEDRGIFCILLVGVPGAGKSLLAKCLGNYAGVRTISLDFKAMQGGIVGETSKTVRNNLKIIDSFAARPPLLIATANKIEDLSPELKSRFSIIMFFDIPSKEETDMIWPIQMRAHDIAAQTMPDATNWTGREIRKCCLNAKIVGVPLVEATKFFSITYNTDGDKINALRQQAAAEGWISANYEGPYILPEQRAALASQSMASAKPGGRRIVTEVLK